MFLGSQLVCQALSKHTVEGICCELLCTGVELNEPGNPEKCMTSVDAIWAPRTERAQALCLKGCQSGISRENDNLEKNTSDKWVGTCRMVSRMVKKSNGMIQNNSKCHQEGGKQNVPVNYQLTRHTSLTHVPAFWDTCHSFPSNVIEISYHNLISFTSANMNF